ncbi:histidine kinase [uncultured Psychroserpens sp.]|uniref:tetratricopeptide repeat-containing sensor histidine kinase n=1 Tax=uncultured Psychroserpens sp. TaxID=255436 RepID=UPI002619AB53|nr:histidine kinase [uncultured Psychroserpens sp.]
MKILLFFITFLINYVGYSQNEDILTYDANKVYTQKYVDSINKNNLRIKLSDYKKILESDKKLKGWTRYYAGLASLASRENKYDSVFFYADKAIKTYNDLEVPRPVDEHYLVGVYINKARSLKAASKDYKNSIINYQAAIDLSKIYPYKYISYVTAGIADAHIQMGNKELALKYFLEVEKDSVYMNISRPAVVTLTKIGALYKDMNNVEEARKYYNKGLDKSINSDYKSNIPTLYAYLAFTYHQDDKYLQASKYFKQAIEAIKANGVGDFPGAQFNYDFLKCYVEVFEGKTNKAIEDLKELLSAIKGQEKINRDDYELATYVIETLGIAYQKKGNASEYKALIKESSLIYERYNKEQQQQELQNLETSYQTKEKDASIAQLEESKKQQGIIIKQQRTIGFGLAGLFLLALLLGVLFFKQRKLKNKYEKENLEQRLLRSQMNPHFIGNAMNTVSALVNKKSDDAIPYINKLSNLFRLVLTNSREEFVSLEDELTTLNSYLELQSQFSKDFDFSFNIDQSIDQEEFIIPPMLIQPFVENAILHGLKPNHNRGRVDIKISRNEKGLLLCEIDDNGVGYSKGLKETKKQKSVSGDIIKERLEILKNKFKVDARYLIKNKDQGTQVKLYLPYLLDV